MEIDGVREYSVRPQPMELVLHIRGVEGMDDNDGAVLMRRRYYVCVGYWMEPDRVYFTRDSQAGWSNPVGEEVYVIPVIEFIPGNYGFLNVEVARLGSKTDPGTSSGTVIVGRARVPLPRPQEAIEGRFELVRHRDDGHMCIAGNIILRMQLQRKF